MEGDAAAELLDVAPDDIHPDTLPEMSESFSAVENPGRKMRLSISSSLTAASDAIRPFCCARRFIVSRAMPRPSSLT